MFDSVDLQNELVQSRKIAINSANVLDWVEEVFQNLKNDRQKIKEGLKKSNYKNYNNFDLALLNPDNIFHIDHIKKVSCDYRLRFLSTSLFKGDYPDEAISKIRVLENQHNIKLDGFKIMAPSKLFVLKNPDDPCLFAPLSDNYYYLIHKWGNDMSYFRKLKFWAVKNVENCIKSILILSLFLTIATYSFIIPSDVDFVKVLLVFMFYFKSFIGFSILMYGVCGKSFSSLCWKSEYNKITS
jgi:hypothetical protein